MAGYVDAVPAFVCFELPARETSSFCDFWKLTSCNFIVFISSLIEADKIMPYPLFPLNCYILNWQAKNSKHNQNKSLFMHHYVAHK